MAEFARQLRAHRRRWPLTPDQRRQGVYVAIAAAAVTLFVAASVIGGPTPTEEDFGAAFWVSAVFVLFPLLSFVGWASDKTLPRTQFPVRLARGTKGSWKERLSRWWSKHRNWVSPLLIGVASSLFAGLILYYAIGS